jgi:uncharacterized protein (TIGR02186 family)
VETGTFYDGAKMSVAGLTGAGNKIIVVVRGPSTSQVFNKIGRVGVIWVTTGKVTISAAPSLLLIFSSEPLNACLSSAASVQYQLDLGSLKKHLRIDTKAQDRDRIADDFLAFEARQGNYRLNSVSVQTGALTHDGLPFSLNFEMPKSAAAGKYEVSVLQCRDGNVVNKVDVDFTVVAVGLPALVSRLARERASLYGFISIIIAMVAGFGVDFAASHVFER